MSTYTDVHGRKRPKRAFGGVARRKRFQRTQLKWQRKIGWRFVKMIANHARTRRIKRKMDEGKSLQSASISVLLDDLKRA